MEGSPDDLSTIPHALGVVAQKALPVVKTAVKKLSDKATNMPQLSRDTVSSTTHPVANVSREGSRASSPGRTSMDSQSHPRAAIKPSIAVTGPSNAVSYSTSRHVFNSASSITRTLSIGPTDPFETPSGSSARVSGDSGRSQASEGLGNPVHRNLGQSRAPRVVDGAARVDRRVVEPSFPHKPPSSMRGSIEDSHSAGSSASGREARGGHTDTKSNFTGRRSSSSASSRSKRQ
ncbi:hypothetical protein P389DRAFT_211379 [Cystobasidium minutum MCA 4210]|uniref:uncharacterized protein n=1 Tax=Cystobasidium minutum MCA 4210 TaxID=1397322 RepID=UPI0034CFDF2E|eukprot:jgi/Rhomi1/211379/estExt_Genemark1.C_4_t30054